MFGWFFLHDRRKGVNSMSLSNGQRSGFEDRLSRIKKGGANTMGEVHIGPRDEERARKGKADNVVRVKKKKNKKAATLGEGSTTVLAPVGILLGGLAMFVGQATDYQLFHDGGLMKMAPPVEAMTPYMQYAPFVFGGVLALMFAWTFRLTTMIRFSALMAGFVAAFIYQAEMVQAMPGMYKNFFSKEFVKTTLSEARAAKTNT